MIPEYASCAQCPFETKDRTCRTEDGKYPNNCPTISEEGLIEQANEIFSDPAINKFAKAASIQESSGYGNRELGYDFVKPIKPRIVEIIEFAQRMNYKKLGLAFCIGLQKEAKIVDDLLSSKGFEMASAICKVGRVPKEQIGVKSEEKIAIGQFETMCNPVLQAMVLNKAKTDFNILLGLCVGHDSLFLKYSDALCTVLAAKDRVTGHNPLAAIYNIDSYYRSIK
jgi:uncharacterized metal-binding protein